METREVFIHNSPGGPMNFLGMGPAELLLVLALALIVFGPDKMPDIARQLGKTVGDLRRVTSDVTRELQRSIQEDPSTSGPRIVRQSPSSNPPPQAEPTPAAIPSMAEPTPSAEPRILPPSNSGAPSTPPFEAPTPVQGSWEDGPAQPTSADRGPDPRRTA
jgi:Tat protein translocase TatB subunit